MTTKPEDVPTFRGEGYETHKDHLRLGAQHLAVVAVMKDNLPHTLKEISERSGSPEASASAQIRFMRTTRFGTHVVVKKRPKEEGGTYFYTLDPEPGQSLLPDEYPDRPVYVPPNWTEEQARQHWSRLQGKTLDLFGKDLRAVARADGQDHKFG